MSKRWRYGGGLVVLIAAALLLGWWLGAGGGQEDQVWERIQRTGEMRVGMDASFPPFEWIQDDRFMGYDVDLAHALAARLGVAEVKLVNIHFDGLYDALQDGKCDVIISALPYERERTRDVDYSVPYFHAGQVIVAPVDASISGPTDLNGRTVAVELGSQGHYVTRVWTMQRGAPWDVVTGYSADEALGIVVNGGADAAIVDAVTAFRYLGQHATHQLELVGEQLTDEPYVIAVVESSDILLDKINRALADMEADGSQASLMRKWFNYPSL